MIAYITYAKLVSKQKFKYISNMWLKNAKRYVWAALGWLLST